MSDESELDNLILESVGDDKPKKSTPKKSTASAKASRPRSSVHKSKPKSSKSRRKQSSDSDDDSDGFYPSDGKSEEADDRDFDDDDDPEKLPWGPNGYGDEEDRNQLMSMDEVKREEILAERLEMLQHIHDRRYLKERIRASEGSSSKSLDASRRSNRAKAPPVSAQSRQLSELKRRREQKSTRSTRVKSESPEHKRRRDRDRSRSYSGSSGSGSDNSESENEEEREKKRGKKIISFEELNRVWLPRKEIVKWMHLPWFQETVVGCFVRYNCGLHPDTRMLVYRVCEILDVGKHHKAYSIDESLTDKNLKLRHANSVKNFPMDMISNSPFTYEEYQRWLSTCQYYEVKPVMYSRVQEMEPILENARSHIMTNEDVDAVIKSKKALEKTPHNSAMQKAGLLAQLEFCKNHGKMDEAAEIEDKLGKLDMLARGTSENKLDKFAAINKRNRAWDQLELRQAEQQEMERRKQLATANSTDPFARRKTVPKLVHEYMPKAKDSSPVPKPNLQTNVVNGTIAVIPVSDQASEIGRTARPMSTYEKLMAEQELDIDLDD